MPTTDLVQQVRSTIGYTCKICGNSSSVFGSLNSFTYAKINELKLLSFTYNVFRST